MNSHFWERILAPLHGFRVWWNAVALRDKTGAPELKRKYGGYDWAAKAGAAFHDLEAPDVNANVYIATRAISDAIKSLPVRIVEVETIRGAERVVEDNDHPANQVLKTPNAEHSFGEILDYATKAVLTDGNAVFTLEKFTGPNARVEMWPRDPRFVKINIETRSYRFGEEVGQVTEYPRSSIVHIRDVSLTDPLWGVGRIATVRDEILMDYYINTFNKNFFKYGATLNLMFTPDKDLTEDQHMQLLDAMSTEIAGADKAFKLFINRFSGKFETPDQKHKDLGFPELIKNNREKIFGVFGLPPFRGGIMEYANYANALQQDADFWQNTVKPITQMLETAFNRQLFAPVYGETVQMRFDFSGVVALQGDKTTQVKILLDLKRDGVVSAKYVREQLDIDESAAPDEEKKPAVLPTINDEDNDPAMTDEAMQPTEDEKQAMSDALISILRIQRDTVIKNLDTLTCNGMLMSVICDPHQQVNKVFDRHASTRKMCEKLLPLFNTWLLARGVRFMNGHGVFEINNALCQNVIQSAALRIEELNDQMIESLITMLNNADKYNWNLPTLQKHVRMQFNSENLERMATVLLREFAKTAHTAVREVSTLKQITGGHSSAVCR